MAVNENVQAGGAGHAQHHIDLAKQGNAVEQVVSTGRLSASGVKTTIGEELVSQAVVVGTDSRLLADKPKPIGGRFSDWVGSIKSAGRALVAFHTDGSTEIFKLTVSRVLSVFGARFVDGRSSIRDDLFAIKDRAGRGIMIFRRNGQVSIRLAPDSTIPQALLASPELANARGSQPTLGDRLAKGLTAAGYARDYRLWPERLRWTRMLMRRILAGDTPTQLDIIIIGDSYSQNRARWTGSFWLALKNLLGDAGVGWVGFSHPNNIALINGSVRPDTTVALAGTWAPTYYGQRSPDLGEMLSNTAGSTVTVTFPAGQTSARLFFIGSADGQLDYQFNGGGALTTLDTNVGVWTLQTALLAAPSAAATALTLTVKAGTVILCGVDLRNGANGVRVHKIAGTGSSAAQWAAVSAASWNAGIQALTPKLAIVMHGPNDQTSLTPAVTFAGRIQTILANLNTALGANAYDRLVMMPPENQRGLAATIASYAAATLPVAEAGDAAYVDLQPVFGVTPADYAPGSTRPWFAADNLHPDPPTGGRAITETVLRVVTAQ